MTTRLIAAADYDLSVSSMINLYSLSLGHVSSTVMRSLHSAFAGHRLHRWSDSNCSAPSGNFTVSVPSSFTAWTSIGMNAWLACLRLQSAKDYIRSTCCYSFACRDAGMRSVCLKCCTTWPPVSCYLQAATNHEMHILQPDLNQLT